MSKALPAKIARELDSYKFKATKASRKAKEMPMKCAVQSAQIGALTGATLAAVEARMPMLDSTMGRGGVAGVLAAYGVATGSPAAVQAAGWIAGLIAYNLVDDVSQAATTTE